MKTNGYTRVSPDIATNEEPIPEYLQDLSGDERSKLELYAKSYCSDVWAQKTIDKCRSNDGTMVTVVCITYNHEDYIAEALESFVMQETTFPFKVLVGDDVSSDNTASIILDYAQRYPDIIVPVIREHNLGANRNLIDLAQRADSPFVAFCEGDDYWVDPKKLQIQFDYMLENPELHACFGETYIDAPEDWYLNSYYKPLSGDVRCIPGSIPGFDRTKETYDARSYIRLGPAHTSSMFFRWDYGLDVPECYFEQASGDHSIMMMQMGKGRIGFTDILLSAYRRSEVGITMFQSKDEHFLKTRTDWIEVLQNLRAFFIEHYDGFAVVDIENRMKKEAYNYLNVLVHTKDAQRIASFFNDYPGAIIALDAFLSHYQHGRRLTNAFTWDGFKYMVNGSSHKRHAMVQRSLLLGKMNAERTVKTALVDKKRQLGIVNYWANASCPIEQGLWVFAGFNGNSYCDNSKYLFEYVCEHHPEIHAVWLTKSKDVYEQLMEKGLPVEMMDTSEAKRLMRNAEVAVTDHFVMSDYGRPRPLNPNTAILQLWHGVGLKSMANLGLTAVKGVRYLDDLDDEPGDSAKTRAHKALRRFIDYPKSEQCEQYALMVVPGQEMQRAYEEGFHLPAERFFVAGYPRMDAILAKHEQEPAMPKQRKILFAPTYRWSPYDEAALLDDLLDNIPAIDAWAGRLDATFVLRLHPHTWRSYQQQIAYVLADTEHIEVDNEQDIYQNLDDYSVLVTDYSSIAYDFLLLDRPMVFFCPDLERYLEHENALNYPFEEYTPGKKAYSWDELERHVKDYFDDPSIDADFRHRIRDFFYHPDAQSSDSSERIVQEMQRRLSAPC